MVHSPCEMSVGPHLSPGRQALPAKWMVRMGWGRPLQWALGSLDECLYSCYLQLNRLGLLRGCLTIAGFKVEFYPVSYTQV